MTSFSSSHREQRPLLRSNAGRLESSCVARPTLFQCDREPFGNAIVADRLRRQPGNETANGRQHKHRSFISHTANEGRIRPTDAKDQSSQWTMALRFAGARWWTWRYPSRGKLPASVFTLRSPEPLPVAQRKLTLRDELELN